MREYEALDQSALVEMLLQNTEKLTQLLKDKEYNVEYHNCKKLVEEITDEIRRRKQNPNQKQFLL